MSEGQVSGEGERLRWRDIVGMDPDYTEGLTAQEFLDDGRCGGECEAARDLREQVKLLTEALEAERTQGARRYDRMRHSMKVWRRRAHAAAAGLRVDT